MCIDSISSSLWHVIGRTCSSVAASQLLRKHSQKGTVQKILEMCEMDGGGGTVSHVTYIYLMHCGAPRKLFFCTFYM